MCVSEKRQNATSVCVHHLLLLLLPPACAALDLCAPRVSVSICTFILVTLVKLV